MRNSPVVLIVATHPQQCKALVRAFEKLVLRSALAFTVEEACRTLESASPTLVVTAPVLLDGTYQDVLQQAKKRNLPTVLLLRPDEVREYQAASDAGVAGLLTFPFSHGDVERVLRRTCGPAIGLQEKKASA
jgi:DNA-binding NtrC family response regulator